MELKDKRINVTNRYQIGNSIPSLEFIKQGRHDINHDSANQCKLIYILNGSLGYIQRKSDSFNWKYLRLTHHKVTFPILNYNQNIARALIKPKKMKLDLFQKN